MFLFSTPQTSDAQPANPVVNAIRDGAQKTGAGFDYLLKTAQRESALAPDAKAKTSSATASMTGRNRPGASPLGRSARPSSQANRSA